jgi:hypothetical protein
MTSQKSISLGTGAFLFTREGGDEIELALLFWLSDSLSLEVETTMARGKQQVFRQYDALVGHL